MKLKNEIIRAENILIKDSDIKNDSFISLFEIDIANLISDYFTLYGKPNIEFKKENGKILVKISFNAFSIKNFMNN